MSQGPIRTPIERPPRFTRCYGCGVDNPRGLALQFFRAGDFVEAEFVPAAEYGGYGRLLHGGVTSTALDEAFGWATYGVLGKLGMTTELEIKFLAPLYCGDTLRVRANILSSDELHAVVRAEVIAPGERLAAWGVGKMRFASVRAMERIGSFKAG